MDLKSLKNFDWRSLQKFASPKASEDLNKFLENLPQNTSNLFLIMTAVVWSAAAVTGLFVTVKVQSLTELRAEYQEAQALQPSVPGISNVSIDSDQVRNFSERVSEIYLDLDIKSSGGSIELTAPSLVHFGQFREAVGHVQNGGSGWRVNVERLCVGKECRGQPLSAVLKINKVQVVEAG